MKGIAIAPAQEAIVPVPAGACPPLTMVGPLPPPFGGMSVHGLRLTNALCKAGWPVRFQAAARTPPETISKIPFLGNSVIRHLRALSYDEPAIVHVHHRLSPLTLALALAASNRGIPLVVTLHGPPFNLFRRSAGLDTLMRLVFQRCAHIIAVSPHIRSAIEQEFDGPITVLPAYLPPTTDEVTMVDRSVIDWLALDPDLPLALLTVYRLLPPVMSRKDVYGLALASEAVQELERRGTPLRFAVMLSQPPRGHAEEGFLSRIVGALQRSLGERFHLFVGCYAPPLIARANVLLRPTASDGDAVSVREALHFGVPVIASDVAPRPEGVLIHRAGDALDLAEKIQASLEKPRTNSTPTTRALDVGAYVEIYRSALSSYRAQHQVRSYVSLRKH